MKQLSLFSKILLSLPVVCGSIMGAVFFGVDGDRYDRGLLYLIPALIIFLRTIWKHKERKEFIYNSLIFGAISFYLVSPLALINIFFSSMMNDPKYLGFVYLAILVVIAGSVVISIPFAVILHIIATLYKYKKK